MSPKRTRRRRSVKWLAPTIGLIAVAVTALIVFYAFQSHRNALSASEISAKNNAIWDEYKQEAAEEAEESRVPTALFIGDSYSAGAGASSKSKGWTTLLSHQQGWREVNKALGGTGFVATSDKRGCGRELCENYIDNLASYASDYSAPDFVVVAGGQNDFSYYIEDPAKVEKAIDTLYKNVRKAYPKTTIISVGPSTPGTIDQTVLGIDAAVQVAAENVDAKYVSLIAPNVIKKSMIAEDGAHVKDDGHEAIAKRVNDALSK